MLNKQTQISLPLALSKAI